MQCFDFGGQYWPVLADEFEPPEPLLASASAPPLPAISPSEAKTVTIRDRM